MRPLAALLVVTAILLGAPPGGGDEADGSVAPVDERTAAPAADSAPQGAAHADAAVAPSQGTAETDAPDSPLRGPRATETSSAPTIVQRDFDGRLRRMEGEPEVAALRALDLTAEQRERLDAIVSRRIAAFDAIVAAHVLELQHAFAALGRFESLTSGAERWQAMHEVSRAWAVFAPWRERGSAIDELGDALAPQQQREARRMAHAFRSSLIAERAADLGVPPGSPQVQAHVRLEMFGRLLEESFARQSRAGEDSLEQLTKALALTPEQSERARAIFGRLYEKEAAREATHWDRFAAISEFMRELAPHQRARAWRFLREQGN